MFLCRYALSVSVCVGGLRLTNRALAPVEVYCIAEPRAEFIIIIFVRWIDIFAGARECFCAAVVAKFCLKNPQVPAAQPIVANLGLKLISLSRMKSPLQC